MIASPFVATRDGVTAAVRATPRAARNGIEGLIGTSSGGVALKVRVNAPAEGGKANAELLKLLAKAWKVPKSSLSLVRGETGRRKTVLISGDPEGLEPRLRDWLATHEWGG